MAVIVNTSTTTTTCSGPQDVPGKPLVMQGQPQQTPRKSQSAPTTTKRVSFNFNDSQVYSVKSFRYGEGGILKDELWYTPMEHMEMQLRINEMIEKLSYVNPAFAEIMYGDTFRGLERILAKRQGLQDEQYDADEYEFMTTQSGDDEDDEYHDAAICSRNTWSNTKTCRVVVASVLWSNHYNPKKPSSSSEEPQHHDQQQSQLQFQILPSMIAGLLVKSDHQVKKEKTLLQQRVVQKYLLKSMESANRAIDLAAGDKRFVDEVYSTTTTMSTRTSNVRSKSQQEESSNGQQQHQQRMVTTTKKSPSVSSTGTAFVEKLVSLQHVQQQQFAAEAC